MFPCPNCRTALRRWQRPEGIQWVCPDCDGRAVAVPVLRTLVRENYLRAAWSASITRGQQGRSCPICRRTMREAPVPLGEETHFLDVCGKCQFVWFDPTEFELAPAHPRKPSKPKPPPGRKPQLERLALERLKQEVARQSEPPRNGWEHAAAELGLALEVDGPPPRHQPVATWCLMGTLALFCVGPLTARHDISEMLDFLMEGGGFLALMNLWYLWTFGDNTEDVLGPPRYLALVGMAAVVGLLSHPVAAPRIDLALSGAGAAVSAILAFYALTFPHGKVAIIREGFLFVLPVWLAATFWVMVQLVGLAVSDLAWPSPPALAHLGGAAVGFFGWWHWRGSQHMPPGEPASTSS